MCGGLQNVDQSAMRNSVVDISGKPPDYDLSKRLAPIADAMSYAPRIKVQILHLGITSS